MIDLYEKALRIAALEAYQNEVIDTETEKYIIGPNGEYADKDDWLESRIEDWLEEAREGIEEHASDHVANGGNG